MKKVSPSTYRVSGLAFPPQSKLTGHDWDRVVCSLGERQEGPPSTGLLSCLTRGRVDYGFRELWHSRDGSSWCGTGAYKPKPARTTKSGKVARTDQGSLCSSKFRTLYGIMSTPGRCRSIC
jgi:hypothetical protein